MKQSKKVSSINIYIRRCCCDHRSLPSVRTEKKYCQRCFDWFAYLIISKGNAAFCPSTSCFSVKGFFFTPPKKNQLKDSYFPEVMGVGLNTIIKWRRDLLRKKATITHFENGDETLNSGRGGTNSSINKFGSNWSALFPYPLKLRYWCSVLVKVLIFHLL